MSGEGEGGVREVTVGNVIYECVQIWNIDILYNKSCFVEKFVIGFQNNHFTKEHISISIHNRN